MKVIALTGRAGSGKDTAARAIQLLTRAMDPTWLMSNEGTRDNVVDLEEYFDTCPIDGKTSSGDWPILKFAYPVYQVAAILVGREVNDIMSDPTFKNQVQFFRLTGRELLQKIGTESFREVIGTNVWVSIMHRELLRSKSEGLTGVIITDLRFKNEYEYLTRTWDSTTIKMVGRDSGVPTVHQSESEIEQILVTRDVYNTGDYASLMDILSDFCGFLNIHNCKYTWK